MAVFAEVPCVEGAFAFTIFHNPKPPWPNGLRASHLTQRQRMRIDQFPHYRTLFCVRQAAGSPRLSWRPTYDGLKMRYFSLNVNLQYKGI
jgi:hypothetical protein